MPSSGFQQHNAADLTGLLIGFIGMLTGRTKEGSPREVLAREITALEHDLAANGRPALVRAVLQLKLAFYQDMARYLESDTESGLYSAGVQAMTRAKEELLILRLPEIEPQRTVFLIPA